MAANVGSKAKGKAQEGGTGLEWSGVAGDIDGDGRRRDPHFSSEGKANRIEAEEAKPGQCPAQTRNLALTRPSESRLAQFTGSLAWIQGVVPNP